MEKKKNSAASVKVLLALSIMGLAFVPVLVLWPSVNESQIPFRQSLIGILFTAVCLLGTTTAFYPSKCRGIFGKTQNPLSQTKSISRPLQIRGHHPDCQNFSGNRIKFGGKIVCAACSGLIVGAIIALIGTTVFFFVGSELEWGGVWLLAFGEVGMMVGLAQIKFTGCVKALANVVLVVGSFGTLTVADQLAKNLFVDLYVVGLILFLLLLRISLSEWNNKRVCQNCNLCI